MQDLSKLNTTKACDKAVEIELRHPTTNEPLGQFIGIVGKDGTVFREHVRKSVNAKLRADAVAAKRSRNLVVATVEETEEDAIDLLVACTTSFRTAKNDKDGEPGGAYLLYNGKVEFSPDNATQIYTDAVWIRAQVDTAIGDLDLFFTA